MADVRVSLFISTRESERAGYIGTVTRACERQFLGRYELTVVDVDGHPEALLQNVVLATPAVVFERDSRRIAVVGDLGHEQKLCEQAARLDDGGTPVATSLEHDDGWTPSGWRRDVTNF